MKRRKKISRGEKKESLRESKETGRLELGKLSFWIIRYECKIYSSLGMIVHVGRILVFVYIVIS